jgi:hypothetical protein
MGNPTLIEGSLSGVRVIMKIMCVLMVKSLCQARVGAHKYVLSCETLNGTASQGSSSIGAYQVLESPRCDCRGPDCVLSQVTRRSYHRLVGSKILLAHGHRNGTKDWYGLAPGLVFLGWRSLPF